MFSFIAVNKQELLECHAFLAKQQKIVSNIYSYISLVSLFPPPRKDYTKLQNIYYQAQAATLTIAQAFSLAFCKWKEQIKEEKKEMGNEEKKTEKNMELTMCDVSICGCILDGRQESASLVMDDAGISRIKGMTYRIQFFRLFHFMFLHFV